jgi:hypothetical protein
VERRHVQCSWQDVRGQRCTEDSACPTATEYLASQHTVALSLLRCCRIHVCDETPQATERSYVKHLGAEGTSVASVRLAVICSDPGPYTKQSSKAQSQAVLVQYLVSRYFSVKEQCQDCFLIMIGFAVLRQDRETNGSAALCCMPQLGRKFE